MADTTAHTHAALDTLEYEDGTLVWGGRKVTQLAAETGMTPFYAKTAP